MYANGGTSYLPDKATEQNANVESKKIQRLFFILKAKIIITNYVYKNLKI